MFRQLAKQKVNVEKAERKERLAIRHNPNYEPYRKEENDSVTGDKSAGDNISKMPKKPIKLAKETKKALTILLKLVPRKTLIQLLLSSLEAFLLNDT